MSTAQPGTVMVDRYRLTQTVPTDLAAAEAWEAHDQILDRPVRVTFVGGPHSAGALDAARRAALVSDPRLCRVLDVGTIDLGGGARPYIISEPYAGSTLTQIVSGGLVDPQQARAVVGEAAAAIEAARQRGVHHLTLRPEAIRVDGHRVQVTGLGLDAGLAGVENSGDGAAAADARDLVALVYYALTARWAGSSLDESWISSDAVRPLPAQPAGTGIVSVSSLVPHVDPDLDELVTRTFSRDRDDAPRTPADVVAALKPWGQVSVVAALPGFVQPAAEQPVRSSVLGVASTGPARPGTPPPAAPVRRPSSGRIARSAAIGAAAGAGGYGATSQQPAYGDPTATMAYQQQGGGQPTHYGQGSGAYPDPGTYAPTPTPGQPTAPVHSGTPLQSSQQGATNHHAPVPPPPPAGSGSASGFASTPAPRRRGVNPTPIVLGVVIAAVVGGAIWAGLQAFDPFEPTIEVNPSATAEAGGPSPEPTADDGAGSDETDEPEVRPVIESGDQLDPEGGEFAGEHPEAVELAYDADPSTFWYTRKYNTPEFGGLKSGIGYVITLEEAAPVSKIELSTNSSGGHVEVRKGTADNPTSGDVLASGSFADTTMLELEEPAVGESFVLWITELPQTNGENRLELTEIVVS